MRRARVTLLAAPAALVTLVAMSLPAGAERSQHVLFPSSCNNERYKPSSIMIACGDATLKARDLRWRTWTHGEARAKGIARYNDCRPDCADGHHHTRPATVKLTKPRSCPHGVEQFSRLRLNYLKPAPGPQHSSWPFPCGNAVPGQARNIR